MNPKRGDLVYLDGFPDVYGILKGVMWEDFGNDPPALIYSEEKDKLFNLPYSMLRVKEN